MATRIAQIMQRRSCSEKETQKAIAAIDRDRAQHYHYYSDKNGAMPLTTVYRWTAEFWVWMDLLNLF